MDVLRRVDPKYYWGAGAIGVAAVALAAAGFKTVIERALDEVPIQNYGFVGEHHDQFGYCSWLILNIPNKDGWDDSLGDTDRIAELSCTLNPQQQIIVNYSHSLAQGGDFQVKLWTDPE